MRTLEPYKSSVLRCRGGDDQCKVCAFLDGNRDEETLLHVIRVLDQQLAEMEKDADELWRKWVNEK